jgi:hypothetical protein
MKTRVSPRRVLAMLAIATAGAVTLAACRPPPDPIVVRQQRITISNPTDEPWNEVQVDVNGYYRAQTRTLGPKGRLDIPVHQMQNAYGRFFDPKRERVQDVKVTATTEGGKAVEHTWKEPHAIPGSG